MNCPECGRRIYMPISDDEDRCAGCVRKEERERSSSSSVPKGFWDRTAATSSADHCNARSADHREDA